MSTKIYNGIAFKGDPDIRQLNKIMEDLKKDVIKKGIDLARKMYYKDFCIFLDLYAIDKDKAKEYYKEYCKNEFVPSFMKIRFYLGFLDKVKEADKKPFLSVYDFGCSVRVFPIHDKILGMYFTQKSELSDIILSHKNIIDYHYQNQTDKPDDISDEEWNLRERDWDKALPGLGIPLMHGFSTDLFRHEFIDFQDMVRYSLSDAPSIEERARNIVYNLSSYDKVDPNDAWAFFGNDFTRYVKEETERIKKLLPKEPIDVREIEKAESIHPFSIERLEVLLHDVVNYEIEKHNDYTLAAGDLDEIGFSKEEMRFFGIERI